MLKQRRPHITGGQEWNKCRACWQAAAAAAAARHGPASATTNVASSMAARLGEQRSAALCARRSHACAVARSSECKVRMRSLLGAAAGASIAKGAERAGMCARRRGRVLYGASRAGGAVERLPPLCGPPRQ